MFKQLVLTAVTVALITQVGIAPFARAAGFSIFNVSYDPTREPNQEYNKACAKYWKVKPGVTITVKASYVGSGQQGVFR